MHLGGARWLLVDSCVAPESNVPASADYLNGIGVSPQSVKFIVASHWHDDHVKGMSQLVKMFATADLFVPEVLADVQSRAFLAAYSGVECSGLSRGTNEMYNALMGRREWIAVKNRTEVFQDRTSTIPVQVVAFSPTQAVVPQLLLARILAYVPKDDMPITHAPEISQT